MDRLYVCFEYLFSGRGAAGDMGADFQPKPTIIAAAALTPEREEARSEESIR